MSEVRRVMPEEWVTLRSIRLTALKESPRSFSSTHEREAGWDEQKWRDGARSVAWFLAWRDGRPVGIAGGRVPRSEPSGEHESKPAGPARGDRAAEGPEGKAAREVISMWVDPSARGTGIADALIGTVAGWARAEGARTLKLWVTDASPRARAFYQRAGFRPTGASRKVPGDHEAAQQESEHEYSLDIGS
jgi:GNAT superfamily N-acetyltransferase